MGKESKMILIMTVAILITTTVLVASVAKTWFPDPNNPILCLAYAKRTADNICGDWQKCPTIVTMLYNQCMDNQDVTIMPPNAGMDIKCIPGYNCWGDPIDPLEGHNTPPKPTPVPPLE